MRTDIACRRRMAKAIDSDFLLMLSRARNYYGIPSWECRGCNREWSSPEDAGDRWLSVFGERFDWIGVYVCGDCYERLRKESTRSFDRVLKHVLQYLLITAGFVAIPFVLYFAVKAFSDVATEVEQEQKTQAISSPSPTLSPEPPAEPSPSPSSLSTPQVSEDARPAEEPSIWELDDVAPSFWLKKRNNGLYDVVANLHWIADGVDEDIEMEPVKVLLELSLDEPGIAIRFIEMHWFNDGLTEEEAWAFLALLYIDSFTPNASTQVSRSPWVMDGVSDFESWAITSLADIFDESPETANSLISKPWFQDGLTEDEAEAVELLGALSYKNGSASVAVQHKCQGKWSA